MCLGWTHTGVHIHFAVGLLNKYEKLSIDMAGFREGIYKKKNQIAMHANLINCILSRESLSVHKNSLK